jgi:peptidoglycan hydrolase CwlO-like protein
LIALLVSYRVTIHYFVWQTGSNYKDLQRENTQLKHDINLLTKRINNPENMNVIHLRAKIEQLENEKHSLQVIIDALCEKINKDKDRLGPQELASQGTVLML